MKKRNIIIGSLILLLILVLPFVYGAISSTHLISPGDNSHYSTGNINFSFNNVLFDAGPLVNATLFTNITGSWAANQSNESILMGGIFMEFINVTGIPEGFWKWNVKVCDSGACAFNDTNYTFTVDTTYPQIEVNTSVTDVEVNNTNLSRDWIYTNVSLVETNFNNIAFELYNSTFSVVRGNVSLSLLTGINWTGLSEGSYLYNVTASDIASNVNSTDTYYLTLDTTAPQVTQVSPVADGLDTDGSVNFTYNVTDATTGTVNCSLYLNGALNATSTSITNGSVNNFTVNGIEAINIMRWSVTCYDYAANSNTTANRTVDTYAAPTASSSSSSSNGKSSVSSTFPTSYDAGEISSGEGYTKVLDEKENIDFIFEGESHNLELNYIIAMHSGGDTNYRAKVTLSSEPVSIFLEEGKSKSVDLDEDGTNDVKVTAKNIDSDSVEITILSLASSSSQGSEAVDSIETTDDSEEAEMPEEETPMAWWIWLIFGVIVFALILGFVMKHNKK